MQNGGHKDECAIPRYFPQISERDDPDLYDKRMSTLTFICGIENAFLFLVLVVFIIVKLVRKDRMTTYTWLCLIIISSVTCAVSITQLMLNEFDSRNCNFTLHIIYGVENIVLFYLFNSIGYKLYLVWHDTYEFAFHENLPTI